MLYLQRKRRHQTADNDQRGSKHHTSLAGIAIGNVPQQHYSNNLSNNQRIRDPRLVGSAVCRSIQMLEDDIDIACNLLLVAVGEVCSRLDENLTIRRYLWNRDVRVLHSQPPQSRMSCERSSVRHWHRPTTARRDRRRLQPFLRPASSRRGPLEKARGSHHQLR